VAYYFFNVAFALGVLAWLQCQPIGTAVFMTPVRIVVMAKAPVAGLAKTRLIPALGAQGAAQLAQRMLQHTLATALASKLGTVELCAAPDRSDPGWLPSSVPADIAWSAQGEGDLGARMARAALRTTSGGASIILIGTDCPGITVATLQEAAAALQHHDASLVPTFDGGYSLLGLRRFHASLFDNMAWSTSTVASETLARMAQLSWQAKVLAKLHDIDEPADIRWLPTSWGYKPVAASTQQT
jgi:uncharacterized protein